LPPLVSEALGELKRLLEDRFPGRLLDVRVFGSMARGEAHEDSDVDVLVVLDRVTAHAERVAPMQLAADAGLPRGLVLQALVMGADELALQRKLETGLAEALDRDGISV
jgi:predicted nucleotidyltransferase